MINLEEYLYNRVLPVIQSWNEEGIYAISFYVYSNEAYVYNRVSNISEFSIGYLTEESCGHMSRLNEEAWDFMCIREGEKYIIEPNNNGNSNCEGLKILFDWYKENAIANIGFEDCNNAYDENMCYIGKGPVGYYELLCAVSNVARRLQIENIIKEKFGSIPIIVHDLEYPWYIKEATENANPNGEASDFFEAMKGCFPK